MRNLQKFGEGMVSEAFLYDDKFVLLKGKRSDSFDSYKRLKKNMDLLEGKIKCVHVPSKLKVIEPCADYPLGALTYIAVKGKELKELMQNCTEKDRREIGKKLVSFISEMQKIKFEGDKQEEIRIASEKLAKSIVFLEPYLSKKEKECLHLLGERYSDFLQKSQFCLTHGDLQEENLILDKKNKLVGIIDFGNMEYYVPEVEFASMMEYDSVIFEEMLKHYKKPIIIENIRLVNQVKAVRFFKHVLGWSKEAILKEVEHIKQTGVFKE